MSGVSACALFCEDVRQEKTGGETLVGVMRDNLAMSSLPGVLPKLGIYIRMNIPLGLEARQVNFYMVMSSGSRNLIGQISVDQVQLAIDLQTQKKLRQLVS
jgi:hypothetical protein